MSSMRGTEIAGLVLGYLLDSKFEKVALEFSKLSPFLQEDYEILKRGLKIKSFNKKKLVDILGQFIEIEETLNEFYNEEISRHEVVPDELKCMRSLKDMVQYLVSAYRSGGSQTTKSQLPRAELSKKRPNTAISNGSDSSFDSTSVSPQATNVQDLPGWRNPSPKRRKMYDPRLLLDTKNSFLSLDCGQMNKARSTPMKMITIAPDPTSSKYLPVSASKRVITGDQLSESFLAHDFHLPEMIAQTINNAFDSNISVDQLNDKLADIVNVTEQYPTFEDIIHEFCPQNDEVQSLYSSSSASKQASGPEDEVVEYRQLDTPVPNETTTSRTNRYELRSHRKSTPALNTSTETKRKKSAKAQIISDERIDPLPESALQALRDEPILVESDSEGTVTTTSQQIIQQPSGQAFVLALDPNTNQLHLVLRANSTDAPFQPAISTTQFVNSANVIDQSQFIIQPPGQASTEIVNLDNYALVDSNSLRTNQIMISADSNQDVRNRLIEINLSDVDKEGNQMVLGTTQQTSEMSNETSQKPEEACSNEQTKEKPNYFAQFKPTSDQKVVTPKQLIKSNIPSSSRSLSTPRNKNPVVRVLNYNTPNRFQKLYGIPEDAAMNTSKYFTTTPQNRSITSSMPSSAPATIGSLIQSEKATTERAAESSSTEVFDPVDENTAISANSDTPRVRKVDRKSCARTLSSHKEINTEENKKRLKRVAQTKKKICPEDGDGNEEDKKADEKKEKAPPTSQEDALAEWQRIRSTRNNPELFEQNLREQNSKKQEGELSTGRNKRSRKAKKKPAAKTKHNTKNQLNESTKVVDMSMNSSVDMDTMNSTQTNLEAQMLEDNLKSAKKITPTKQMIIPKSAKKKTPKLQIKFMPSPKNKALKRHKSAKKETTSALITNEADKKEQPVNTENPVEVEFVQQKVVEMDKIILNENTSDDLEVAQNLIKMQEVILQQENERKKAQLTEIQSDSVSMSEEAKDVHVSKGARDPMLMMDRHSSEILKNINQANLSMSALLDTPFKDGMVLIPKTPGLNAILPSLQTPLLRPCESLMDDSIFKNPLFPTPSFAITPGPIFTPFKDLISPRSDQEIVYGAANRPTDYSSSSSYYKPDESDGIDKQIQSAMKADRKNSGIYSADEIEDTSKIDDSTQNTLNDSSSSSSSSSDSSDSDSDSDSSSSSDSDVSRTSHKSIENVAQPTETNEPEPEAEPVVDEDSKLQLIKSHLVESHDVNIAQDILLSVPEAPMLNEEAERLALLDEKRRRMQESLRQAEMKNHEKMKPKQTKKYRTITEAKRDRLRAQPVAVASPSKRKSTQPKKIVSVASQQIYSKVVNVLASQSEQVQLVEVKTQSVTTERLITEAAGDNAIIDVSDVSTTQNPQKSPPTEEESVEAIEKHIQKYRDVVEVAPSATANEKTSSSKLSQEKLVDVLLSKQKKLDANKPKIKTEMIAALPMRNTRSRTKTQPIIRPAPNILTRPSTSNNTKTFTKPAIQPIETRRSREKSSENSAAKSDANSNAKKAKTAQANTEPAKKEPNKGQPVETKTSVSSKSSESLVTPAKERRSRQILEMFGDCTDIETPIKTDPKANKSEKTKESLMATKSTGEDEAKQTTRESTSNKFEADSSNVNDNEHESDSESGSGSDSESDEDGYEMIFSIDETDKNRFICMRETSSIKSRGTSKSIGIRTTGVVLDGVKITLEPSEEMELYKQDMDSVVQERKDERKRTRSSRDSKRESTEPSSSSDDVYGKPLHTSTPSPTKTITPKFNIRHKSSENISPKSAKKKNVSKGGGDFDGFQIDDVLNQLHSSTE